RLLRTCVLVCLAWVAVEAVSGLCLWVMSHTRGIVYDPAPTALTDLQRANLQQFIKEGSRAEYGQHPILGWVPIADANAAGMRDDREYELTAPAGKIRISAFGDSFVYGSGVKLPDSWLKQLASLDPSLEVLNYGVGAYGLD